MHVIAKSTLAAYWGIHPETRAPLQHWFEVAKRAKWATGSEVMASFPKAKVINGERVRFDVHGGDYRLIVAFNYRTAVAYIKFIGTHAEYDRIDAATVAIF